MAECASIPSDSEDEKHAMPDLSHFSIRKQTSYRRKAKIFQYSMGEFFVHEYIYDQDWVAVSNA
uniref:Uncharacterized protein n=1 Tax=Magallana gigas TaxID=29159 RepID=K1PT83_MAGGI